MLLFYPPPSLFFFHFCPYIKTSECIFRDKKFRKRIPKYLFKGKNRNSEGRKETRRWKEKN
jgi:hypothetical protein